MKVKIEINLEEKEYAYFEKMALALRMRGVEELLQQELEDRMAEIELWLDRQHIAGTVNP